MHNCLVARHAVFYRLQSALTELMNSGYIESVFAQHAVFYRLQSALTELMNSGYIESVKQLRETLLIQEWV